MNVLIMNSSANESGWIISNYGRLKIFDIGSVNREALVHRAVHPEARGEEYFDLVYLVNIKTAQHPMPTEAIKKITKTGTLIYWRLAPPRFL